MLILIQPTDNKRKSERSEIQLDRFWHTKNQLFNIKTNHSRGVHSERKLAQTARELCSIFHLNKLTVIHHGLAVKIVSAREQQILCGSYLFIWLPQNTTQAQDINEIVLCQLHMHSTLAEAVVTERITTHENAIEYLSACTILLRQLIKW